MPMSASVLVNRDEVARAARGRSSTAAPRSSATPAGCSRSASEFLARPAARPTTSSRPARVQAERMVERTEIVREARRVGRAGRRRRRGARRGSSATRPRTTSTRSSPPSRSCSSARCRRCRRAASGSRSDLEPDRTRGRRQCRARGRAGGRRRRSSTRTSELKPRFCDQKRQQGTEIRSCYPACSPPDVAAWLHPAADDGRIRPDPSRHRLAPWPDSASTSPTS